MKGENCMDSRLEFVREMLSDFALTVRGTRGKVWRFTDYTVNSSHEGTVFEYTVVPRDHMDHVRVTARISNDAVILSLDVAIEDDIIMLTTFMPERALSFELSDSVCPEAILGNRHLGPWWMFPEFTDSFKGLTSQTQSFVMKREGLHYHVMSLCGDNFRCECECGSMDISSGMSGLVHIKGDFLSVFASDDPFAAVDGNYRAVRAAGAIDTPLRDEREMPELFRGFGWCTWDAFRNEVTSEKIYSKLDEFKAKDVPVRWLIIDDGWSPVHDMMLTGFKADAEKFPEGLRACIDRIKGEYGVGYVGVWHAFNGYWMGVDPESELYSEWSDCLCMTPSGKFFPSLDEDKAYRFWDAWHSYLADCGVDFLKVDNQSSWGPRTEGLMPSIESVRHAHRAIERSVFKNFGGAVINCMGMDMENVFSRPRSAMSRNSDDFFPGKERGFTDHLMQNVYNAVWHSRLYYCDFDMWWSDHESAVTSGVLRAISGSPIYVSDKIGATKPEYIMPAIEDDGTVMMCDGAAQPTLDCFYEDSRFDGALQKIWNRSGDAFAAAVFNVSYGDSEGELRLETIPGIDFDAEYVVYEYFTNAFRRVSVRDSIPVRLKCDDVSVFSIYPIKTDADGEYIMLGSTDKYVPIASKHKARTAVSEII